MHRARWTAPLTVGLAGKALELLGQAVLIVVVARVLGPSDYGVFALVLAVVTLASATTALGGPTLMARFIGAATPDERAGVARALALRSARFRISLVAVLALAAGVLAVTRPHTFHPVLTLLTVLALTVDVAATLVTQLALGLGRPNIWSMRFAIQNATIAVAAPLGYVVAGVDGAVCAVGLGALPPLAWGMLVVRSQLRGGPRVPIPAGSFRFAALQGVAGFATQVQHRGAIPVLAITAGSAAAGRAAIALGVALAGTYGIWQMSAVTLPALSESLGRDGGLARAEHATRRLAAHALMLATPAALIGVLLAERLVPVLFGHGYAPAARPLALALASLPLAPHAAAIMQCCALRLRAGLRAGSMAAGAAVALVVMIALAPSAGADAAGIALFAGSVTSVVIAAVVLRDALGSRGPAAAVCAAAAVLALALAIG